MTAKLSFLCALTAALVAIIVLLIVLHPIELPRAIDTIVGALIATLSLGAHAVFRESSPTSPGKPANPQP